MKNNTNYFSHDGNANQDAKVWLLVSHKGREGYGIFWRVIEMLFNTDGYKFEISNCQAFAWQMSIEEKKFMEYIELMIKIGLLKSDGKMFRSESLLKRMEIREQIRQKRIQAGRSGGKQSQANAKQMVEQTSTKGQAIKEKERKEKGKEIKIKEKENIFCKNPKDFYDFVDQFLNLENPQIKYQVSKNENYFETQYMEVDKLEKDGYNIETIKTVLQFIKQDEFRSKNILSVKKLRDKDKNKIPYIVRMIDEIKKWKPRVSSF